MTTLHRNFSEERVHSPFFRLYADSTARLADSGFVSDDVNKVALQLDDATMWRLTDESPITWATLEKVPAGGDTGQVLKKASDDDYDLVWADESGGGGAAGALVFLESQTASGSATLDFTSLSDTYNDYFMKISGLIPASNALDLWMRFATDNTPTWDTGNNHRWGRHYLNMAGAVGGTGDGGATSSIVIGASVGTTSGYSFNAEIYLHNMRTAALYKIINVQSTHLIDSDGNLYGLNVRGAWKDSTHKAYGIRLLMSSGNIASGVAKLYGIADS
jgi:hypothetical protein